MNNPNYLNAVAYNTLTKKRVKIYTGSNYKKNPLLAKILKKNSNALRMPKGFVVDTVNNKVIRKRTTTGKLSKPYKRLLENNPNALQIDKGDTEIFNTTTNKFLKKSNVFNKKGGIVAKYKKLYRVANGRLIPLDKSEFKSSIEIKRNNGLVKQRIYLSKTKPNNWVDFRNAIKNKIVKDFTGKETHKKTPKILLKFGNLHRWVRWNEIKRLGEKGAVDMFDDWKNNFGSDVTTASGKKLIDFDKLDTSYFSVSMLDTHKGGGTNVAVKSKFWKTKQPPTKNNTCLEGAINRGLELNRTSKTLRYEIMEYSGNQIKWDEMVKLEDIPIYEDYFKTNINVYVDEPHLVMEKENANCIYESNKKNNQVINILLKDEHYNLITGKKLQISKLTNREKKHFGMEVNKSLKIKKQTVAYNKRKEILVVFDIETVFDKNDHNYLKSYGVSWFVWDTDDVFDYNDGWNKDKTENFFNEEPFCYYKRGEGCLEKFIEFLLNPPDGVIFKPIGFNNSRFDNFAVCEEANRLGLLGNCFFADGSILYMKILGCSNSWDACRFLTGKSLDSACKDYNTNPKKRKDLIDHYEIQCYFEKNGWEGLCKLLDDRPDLVLYNKLDVISLLDLTLKMRSSYEDLFKVDIFDYLTLSSMGYKLLKRSWKEANLNIIEPASYKADRFFRDSLTAGRTQSFYGKYDYTLPVAMGDIKSLYPTVLGNYGDNHCPFPYGKYIYTKKEKVGKLGIYRCNIKHQRCIWKNQSKIVNNMRKVKETFNIDLYKKYAPNVIAKRDEDKPLDWFWKEELLDVKLTSVDIDVLRWATEDLDSVEVLEGYYWEQERTDLFVGYLDPPKKEKTRQDRLKAEGSPEYNEAKREGCKGISNSMSGKLLEAIHTDVLDKFSAKTFIKYEKDDAIKEIDLVDFGRGFCMIKGKKEEEAVFNTMKERKPSYLGMFCYSYARKLMYQKILSRYITLYMDTDSACMPLMEWDRLCNENIGRDFVDTGEYGCIEEEVCKMEYCSKCKLIKDTKSYRDKKTKDGKKCKDCNFTPANRVIAIAPKNYLVENETHDNFSKRKFKGVRKNDFWLPLSYFGEILHEIKNDKVILKEDVGTAKYKIKNLTQEEIRRIREFKCCNKCINGRIYTDTPQKCKECDTQKDIMKKTYSTEMFEYLAKGNKIAIFCSMINRIQYKVGDLVEWEYEELTKGSPTLNDLTMIMDGFKTNGTMKNSITMKFNVEEDDYNNYHKELNTLYTNVKKITDKKIQNKIIKEWFDSHRKFENEFGTREISDVFKLKQQYLVKII